MTHRLREQARSHNYFVQGKKTGANTDVAPAEETILIAQAARAATVSGLRDNTLTSTKLTRATARLQ